MRRKRAAIVRDATRELGLRYDVRPGTDRCVPAFKNRVENGEGAAMTRKGARQNGIRARIAAAAARIMAEDGIDDFALAKRKAARQVGAEDSRTLPANDEIEAELRAYRSLYQAEEHPARIDELRRIALDAMRALRQFNPYLTGPVLTGLAGRYAAIDLQLFPESAKEVELFLLNRNIPYTSIEVRRYSGDQARAVALLSLTWEGAPLKVSVFDPRDERLAIKTSQAGRVIERAGLAEVGTMLGSGETNLNGRAQT